MPHTEVDFILVDGTSVDFSYLVDGNQHLSVYPYFNSIEIAEEQRLQEKIAPHNRFLADTNLGKLARYLRMAGFDTAYRREGSDADIIQKMQEEKRILLSRDRKLLMHKVIQYGYLPRSDDPIEQLQEVFLRFGLLDKTSPFSRCPNCNGELHRVSKEEIIDQLEPLTIRHFNIFSQCANCGKAYWAGSHSQRLDPRVKKLLQISR